MSKSILKVDDEARATTLLSMPDNVVKKDMFLQRLNDDEKEGARQELVPMLDSYLSSPENAITLSKRHDEELEKLCTYMTETQKEEYMPIPEAEKLVNEILDNLEGYKRTYGSKHPLRGLHKLMQLFTTKADRGKEVMKAMSRDAKPIEEKIRLARDKMVGMESSLDDSINKWVYYENAFKELLVANAKDLGILEMLMAKQQERCDEVHDVLKKAEKRNEEIVEYQGRKLSLDELKLEYSNHKAVMGELEKTWLQGRQKFFLTATNIQSCQNIASVSRDLMRTCYRMRTGALSSAQAQLVVWRQASYTNQVAQTLQGVNDGVNQLIMGAANESAEAIKNATDVNNRAMLTDETIDAISGSLREQMKILLDAEKVGSQMRRKSALSIQRAEEQLSQLRGELSSKESQKVITS